MSVTILIDARVMSNAIIAKVTIWWWSLLMAPFWLIMWMNFIVSLLLSMHECWCWYTLCCIWMRTPPWIQFKHWVVWHLDISSWTLELGCCWYLANLFLLDPCMYQWGALAMDCVFHITMYHQYYFSQLIISITSLLQKGWYNLLYLSTFASLSRWIWW